MDIDQLARRATEAALATLAKGGDNLAIFEAVKAAIDKASGPRPIPDNQIVLGRQVPGPDDHTLERADDPDTKEEAGPPAVISPYKPPRDKRVQTVLKDAAAERDAAEARDPPRKTFSDPRLDPNYRPQRRPNQPR